MTTIKEYNTFNSESDPYEAMPYGHSHLNLKKEDFTKGEIDLVTNFFASYKSKIYFPKSGSEDYTRSIKSTVKGRQFIINRYFDEWFTVRVCMNSGIQTFKCDGLYGVFALVEKKMGKTQKIDSSEFLLNQKNQQEILKSKKKIVHSLIGKSLKNLLSIEEFIDNLSS